MGNKAGLRGRRVVTRRRLAATVLALTVVATACSSSGGAVESSPTAERGSESTQRNAAGTTEGGPRPCSEDRHMAAFDVFGTLTMSDLDFNVWQQDPATAPPPRPGFAELVDAYRDHGYEILYITTVPGTEAIGGTPVAEAATSWLALNGFPTGEGTSMWTWDAVGTPVIGIVDELVRLTNGGVGVDAGYSDNVEIAQAMAAGGVPHDDLYTVGNQPPAPGSWGLRDDQMISHVAAVQALPDVCTPA